MTPTLRPDAASALAVELTEWDQVGPAQNPLLEGRSLRDDLPAQRLAHMLRSRVDIREGYRGLEINTTSFVGRVDVGPLRIAIRPKLPAMPLACLLRYAYRLRNLSILRETRAPTTRHGFQDLLVAMLTSEVEELVYRGLARRYVPLSERRENPRGRILIDQFIRRGGLTEARLPCQFFDRQVNWQLNQVLRAGLNAAARMTDDRELRRRVLRLADAFAAVEQKPRLDIRELDKVERGLTRLTASNESALTLIRLLHDMFGVGFEAIADPSRTPGFLLDMNIFFQRLLSRFLHDNLTRTRIADELAIRNLFAYSPEANPQRRTAPAQKPDFALYSGTKLRCFFDAKYRDIWERSVPAKWLYQLSIYALASPSPVSVLLYASMAGKASDQRVEVRQPLLRPSKTVASVILRPVSLLRLADLVDPDQSCKLSTERHQWAEDLVSV